MLVHSGLQSTNLCRNTPCPALSQADGQADEELRCAASPRARLVPEILNSKLEEGKCVRKVKQNGLKLSAGRTCRMRTGRSEVCRSVTGRELKEKKERREKCDPEV